MQKSDMRPGLRASLPDEDGALQEIVIIGYFAELGKWIAGCSDWLMKVSELDDEDYARMIPARYNSRAGLHAEANSPRQYSAAGLEGWIEITEATHPALYSALDAISHDGGGGAGHATYAVAVEWVPMVPSVERALASLSAEQRDEFAVGDHDAKQLMIAGSTPLAIANVMLECFFNDWNLE